MQGEKFIMTEYFGVRHHSPACSFYAEEFLERLKPDVLLIEGPSDLSGLIPALCSPDVVLPEAILAYTENAPVHTVLYPMAEYSPEYNAMKWAVRHGVEVRFCDLPSDCVLALRDSEEKAQAEQNNDKQDVPHEPSVYERLKNASGMDNSSFWEYCFEQCESYDDFIEAAETYGSELRSLSENDPHNQLREAFMRKVISECEAAHIGGNIAVITGAFHTAGLKGIPFSAEDKRLTDRLPTIPSRSTLMPYSYYRLSERSGYGAGCKAPGYYEILWKCRRRGKLGDSAVEYLSRIAAYQRKNGFSCSTAEVIEAKRLADALAAMHGGKMPVLADLRDSAVTCLGHGSFGEISLACADTEIGTKIGTMPEGAVCTSVQEDFLRQLKELKLEKYRKASSAGLELDLRENIRVKTEKAAFIDLERSFFLHRLYHMGINFCHKTCRVQENATWAELWVLSWSPEVEIEIVEASLNGDTVAQAAENTLNSRLAAADSVEETANLLTAAFECGLTDCLKTAAVSVQRQTAECSSAASIGKALGSLSGILRYGSIRRLDMSELPQLMEKLFLKFCLCLPSEVVCDKNAAQELISAVSDVNTACVAHDFLDDERFVRMLSDISDNNFANPLLSGYCCAVLMERGKIVTEKLSELISRRLSPGFGAEGAEWFEGFSKKNRRALISRLSVWEKLCEFVAALEQEDFKPVLVCLRRTFSEFTPSEKSDIAENIGEVLGISKQAAAEFMTAELNTDEQQSLSDLDDFDFGDI